MITRSSAFLTRSLRQESRLIGHHLMRGGLVALILSIFGTYMIGMYRQVGAGGQFAAVVLYCCYLCLSLLGGTYFSLCIVEEKEEQTLPLLRMTGATPLAILLGKSIPRLMVALLFLFVITPFLVLSLTLGGLLIWGLLSCVLGLLVYAVMLSQLGALASVCCRNARAAFSLTAAFWTVLEAPFLWAWIIDWPTNNYYGVYDWLAPHSLLLNLTSYLTSWDSTEIWQPQMTRHLQIAGGSLVLSWLLFEPMTAGSMAGVGQQPAPRPTPGKGTRRRSETTARVPLAALAWKSWIWTTGGRRWIAIRCVVPTFLIGVTALAVSGFEIGVSEFAGVLFFFGLLFTLMNTANLLGKVFNTEIRSETFGGLLMLPISRGQLAGRLLLGLLPAIASAACCCGVGLLLVFASGEVEPDDVAEVLLEPAVLHFGTWLAATYSLGLVLSVRLRYGGMILSVVFCWFVAPFLFALCVSGLFFNNSSADGTIFVLLMLLEAFFCVVMARQLVNDIDRLGAQD